MDFLHFWSEGLLLLVGVAAREIGRTLYRIGRALTGHNGPEP